MRQFQFFNHKGNASIFMFHEDHCINQSIYTNASLRNKVMSFSVSNNVFTPKTTLLIIIQLNSENFNDEHGLFIEKLSAKGVKVNVTTVDKYQHLYLYINEANVVIPCFNNAILDTDYIQRYFLKKIFLYFHHYEPVDQNTVTHFFAKYGLTLQSECKDLNDYVLSQFKEVLVKAEKADALWELGQYRQFYFPDDKQKMIDCFQQIPHHHYRFEDAQYEIFHLLMLEGINSELTNSERQSLLQEKFCCALNCSQLNHEAAQLFHELCGYSDLQPRVTKIHRDNETLLALADQIKTLNQANLMLKKQLDQIRYPSKENQRLPSI